MGYFYIAGTIIFTVLGQLLLKWQVSLVNELPENTAGKFGFLFHLLLKPWVLIGLGSAFAASLFWMMALKKLPLSTAYPFTATSFILVMVFSAVVLKEPVTPWKALGTGLVIAGVMLMAAKG